MQHGSDLLQYRSRTTGGAVSAAHFLSRTFILKADCRHRGHVSLRFMSSPFDGMWKVAMSEEVRKALQSVIERVNQAAARRPKVTAARGGSARQRRCPHAAVGVRESGAAAARLVM